MCVCFHRFIWSELVCGVWSHLYVCVCVPDVCWELKHKHQVKLCLLSSWDCITDSPFELTLVIDQALHQEVVWVEKAESEALSFLPVSHICSHIAQSCPKQVMLTIRSLKMANIRVTQAFGNNQSLTFIHRRCSFWSHFWFRFCSRTLQHVDWRGSGLNWWPYH